MFWLNIVCIVFAGTTAVHLGLIRAVEGTLGLGELPLVGCPKCLSFWCCLTYGLCVRGFADLALCLAVSFLASYAAIWLELLECLIDNVYVRLYDAEISMAAADPAPAGPDPCAADGSVPDV